MATTILKSNLKIVRIGDSELSFPKFGLTKLANLYVMQTISPASIFIFNGNDSIFTTEYFPLGSAVTSWNAFVIIPGNKTAKLYVFQSYDGTIDALVQIKTIPTQSDTVAGNLRSPVSDILILPYFKIRLDISPADNVQLGVVLVS